MYKIIRVMKISSDEDFITVARLRKIPFLVHGFGTRNWREQNFKQRPAWRKFKLIFLDQIHSDVVQAVDEGPDRKLKGDAMITDHPFLFLIIKSADCLPVLMVDETRRVIAAVHCGWRGTGKRLIKHVVKSLKSHYGCLPSSLLVAMGPHIGSECYEVGEDVRQSFVKGGFSPFLFQPHPYRNRKYLFNLKKANILELVNSGVKKKNIHSIDICTHCEKIFPSFRRDGERAGRMLSFIAMLF